MAFTKEHAQQLHKLRQWARTQGRIRAGKPARDESFKQEARGRGIPTWKNQSPPSSPTEPSPSSIHLVTPESNAPDVDTTSPENPHGVKA